MEAEIKTVKQLFTEFKEVFPEIGFENLESFIVYCESHSQTQRALFSIRQILLLQILKGERSADDLHELRRMVENDKFVNWQSVYAETMNPILEEIKARA